MAETHLPQDDRDFPIPCMKFNENLAHSIDVTATSARNTTPFDPKTKVVSIFATGAVKLRMGGSGVVAVAADHYFPANVYYDVSLGEGSDRATHIAFLRVDSDCKVYISEKN